MGDRINDVNLLAKQAKQGMLDGQIDLELFQRLSKTELDNLPDNYTLEEHSAMLLFIKLVLPKLAMEGESEAVHFGLQAGLLIGLRVGKSYGN